MSDTPAHAAPDGVEIHGPVPPEFAEILTPEALAFVAKLERAFALRRHELLMDRAERRAAMHAGERLRFLPETESVRSADWQVAPTPPDFQKRWVEITGPTERKMLINALNSGADCFMADCEDANSPTWHNMIQGQINLRDAVDGSISFTGPDGRHYELGDDVANLLVRPRGWHLEDRHVTVDGHPISASLLDFGLYFFHNAEKRLAQGSGPYFYLAKLESHHEARLWNDAFVLAQDELGIPQGSIRATVLIETIHAAFEMDEILYELRDHSAGLNAGRWDYIFSVIKTFRKQPDFLLPDRGQITMTVPFMRAYTELLVRTCHRRGAHAIGGMAAFIPSRRDAEINERALAAVRDDKERESRDGFDGTWVAHPDLVPLAREVFAAQLGDRPHQKERLREDVAITADDLMSFRIEGGQITEQGLRTNISVGILYLESWLRGVGAAALNNLMEDTATAEISRAQVWQWLHHASASLSDGRAVDGELYAALAAEELAKIKAFVGDEAFAAGNFDVAAQLFDRLATNDSFDEFLTLIAYDHLA